MRMRMRMRIDNIIQCAFNVQPAYMIYARIRAQSSSSLGVLACCMRARAQYNQTISGVANKPLLFVVVIVVVFFFYLTRRSSTKTFFFSSFFIYYFHFPFAYE
jgi:hypothetical protein